MLQPRIKGGWTSPGFDGRVGDVRFQRASSSSESSSSSEGDGGGSGGGRKLRNILYYKRILNFGRGSNGRACFSEVLEARLGLGRLDRRGRSRSGSTGGRQGARRRRRQRHVRGRGRLLDGRQCRRRPRCAPRPLRWAGRAHPSAARVPPLRATDAARLHRLPRLSRLSFDGHSAKAVAHWPPCACSRRGKDFFDSFQQWCLCPCRGRGDHNKSSSLAENAVLRVVATRRCRGECCSLASQ